MITIKCKLLHTDAKIPTKVYASDSCFDLYSVEKKVVFPRCYEEVNLGIAVELPFGYGMFLRARSSQGKKGIQIHCGTVDQEFRGKLSVYVYNHSDRAYTISVGDRIAQAFIEPIQRVEFEEVRSLSESKRGKKGWGSSGK